MKNLLLILTLTIFMAFYGCASMPDLDIEMPGEINWDDLGTEVAIESAATTLGYFIGKSGNSEIEDKIAMHYENIKNGRIDLVALNEGLNFVVHGNMDPLLGLLLTNALTKFGAVFNSNGQLVELNIPLEIWTKAEVAYNIGLALGKKQLAWINTHMYAGR